jgi:hypothetical protein
VIGHCPRKLVPRPPVQAPKRRDTRRSSPTLPAWPRWAWIAIAGGTAGIVIVVVVLATTGGGGRGPALPLEPLPTVGPLKAAPSPGPAGPEGVQIPNAPVLAPAANVTPGQTIDGIQCGATEMLNYHIHIHLTIFVDGAAQQVPLGIGIGKPREYQPTSAGRFVISGTCFMWLHTHASDGILHVESPTPKIYTLGNFFAIWGQPLSRTQVGPAHGQVTAFYNGKVYTVNIRDIPLIKHAQIQLMGGKPLIAHTALESWTFAIRGLVEAPRTWS